MKIIIKESDKLIGYRFIDIDYYGEAQFRIEPVIPWTYTITDIFEHKTWGYCVQIESGNGEYLVKVEDFRKIFRKT